MKTEVIFGKKGSTQRKVVIGVAVAIVLIGGYFLLKPKAKVEEKTSKPDSGKPGADTGAADTKKSGKGGKGKGSGASQDGMPSDSGTTAPDGISAPATDPNAGTVPAEGSPILYIVPTGDSKGPASAVDTSQINVNAPTGVFQPGQLVQITHPRYNGKYTITSLVSDGSGGQDVQFDTVPFVMPPSGKMMGVVPFDDEPGGTIAVIGDPIAPEAPSDTTNALNSLRPNQPNIPVGVSAPTTSFEGMPTDYTSLEFSSLSGMKAGKRNSNIRLIPVKEALARRAAQKRGRGLGLKGDELIAHIIKAIQNI